MASRDDVDRWYTLVQAYATLGTEQADRAAALQRDLDEQLQAVLDDLAATTALPEVATAARAAAQLVHLAAWTATR